MSWLIAIGSSSSLVQLPGWYGASEVCRCLAHFDTSGDDRIQSNNEMSHSHGEAAEVLSIAARGSNA